MERKSNGGEWRVKKGNFVQRMMSLMLALIMIASALVDVLPARAAETIYAVSEDGKEYTSVSDAWNAAKNGTKVILQCDWNVKDTCLDLPSKAVATLEMNGYKIYATSKHVIIVREGATLNLIGEKRPSTSISYKGWEEFSQKDRTITSGGLITGGNSEADGGGIHMDAGSKVLLDNVSVAGNYGSGNGGGIAIDGNGCVVEMKNGASIEYNSAKKKGAGIYTITSANSFTLRMDQGSISHNYAGTDGGGIYAGYRNCVIEMKNDSKIDYNSAERGGGIFYNYPEFTLASTDTTGSISHNRARIGGGKGGGIYTCQTNYDNKGAISGVTFEADSANNYGGAIYLDQERVKISNCTITKCAAGENGGGIYNNNDKNTISGCVITENSAGKAGGGVYSDSLNDIALSGKVIIKDNKRDGDSVDDDLYLQDGAASRAYLNGAPSAKSQVGVRTEKKEEALIGKDTTLYYPTAFFYDNDKEGAEYEIRYLSDSSELKIVKKDPSDITTSVTEVSPDTEAAGKYNDQDLIQGVFSFPSVSDTTEDLDSWFYYSDGYFLNGSEDEDAGDPTGYNAHLATMSMSMALAGFYSNIGNDGTKDSDNRTYTYKSQNIEKLLTDIGVDPDNIYINDFNTVKPTTDSIGVAIGQKTIKSSEEDGAEYILVPIAVRGAGYESEWYGNTTVGTSGEHAGFASAADQVFTDVQSYIANYGLEDAVREGRVKFWIAGYSRAGATSNLTAKRLIEAYCSKAGGEASNSNQVYAYCFEAPKGGVNAALQYDESTYYSIHNCINKVDIVPLVAPEEMGFIRYGVDHYVPGTDAGSDVSTDTDVWSYVKDQSWVANYKTWYDNTSYVAWDTNTDYYKQKLKMLPQLSSVDPVNMYFYDAFKVAALNYVNSTMVETISSSARPLMQEEYLQVFCRALQSWGFYKGSEADFRKSYTEYSDWATADEQRSMQTALQILCQIAFGKSSSDLEGMMDGVMAGVNQITLMEKIKIWDEVIGEWSGMNSATRSYWGAYFWNKLMKTKPAVGESAVSYLTSEEQSALYSNWFTLMDVLMSLLEVDYKTNVQDWNSAKTFDGTRTTPITENVTSANKDYTSRTQVIVGTLINNVTSIAQGHYPEINYAWLRSYDSFFDNEEYKAVDIKTDTVPSVESAFDGGTLTLSTDTKGAGIYYRVKSGDGKYGDWKPYNKPVTLSSVQSDDTIYQVQTTAVYCGNTSKVATKSYTVNGTYTVTLNGEIVGSYRAGTDVEIDGTGTDAGKVFKAWTKAVAVYDDKTEELELADQKDAVASFTMPKANVELTADYVTRIGNLTLTVDKPEATKPLADTGTLSWTDAEGNPKSQNVSVYWQEVLADGTTRNVAGNANYATTYEVVASVNQNTEKDIAFALDLSRENVRIVYGSDAAVQSNSASVDNTGKLQIIGADVKTQNAEITKVQGVTVKVSNQTTEAELREKLPQSVVAETEIGNRSIPLNLSGVDLSAFLENGVVKKGGSMEIPLDLSTVTDLNNSKNLLAAVTLEVYEVPVTAAPKFTPDSGTYSGNLTVTLSCDTAEANLYYQIDGGSTTAYQAQSGIVLNGEDGCKKSYTITAWAQSGYGTSAVTSAVYVLDNPFTISIKGVDTGFKQDGLWTKTYKHYKNEKVVIAAPSESSEQFEKWQSIPDGVSGKTTSDVLTIDKLSGNVELTAVYNPIVSGLTLTMDEPTLGKELAEKVTQASATVENTYDITNYIKTIEWSPNDKMPTYDTAYMAKITFDSSAEESGQSQMKYIFSNQLAVQVKNAKGEVLDVKTTLGKEKKQDVLYVTFQKTAKAKLLSVEQPGGIGVSRKNASAGKWNLPSETNIRLSDNTTVKVPISWNETPTYDASNLNAQTSVITGAVTIPEYVDAGEVSPEVTLTVSIPAAQSVVAPTSSLEEGTYTGEQYVRLSCETEGATIYYTLDGSEPTQEESETCKIYHENDLITLAVGTQTTIRAIAVKSGMQTSVTAEYTYQIEAEKQDETKPQTDPSKPSGSDGTSEKTGAKKQVSGTQMGDSHHPLLWCMLLVLCGGILAYGMRRRKK